MSEIHVPVSPGEVLDKITILRIKSARISDATKLANVRRELELLERTWDGSPYGHRDIARDVEALQAVNERLWDIEDRIRDKERAQAFDAEFIALARSVYIENDERAAIKKRINTALGSAIVEEKSYAAYR
jgi:DNA-binding transcriptional regulator PaaX